jgi:hypothetical protein
LRVFDVANVDNKGFSERFVTAPVSPIGQQAYARTEFATGVALPTNMMVEYGRVQNPENLEQPMSPIYKYAYVSDRFEGLVVVDVNVLADRDPRNNFLERAATFNPDGILNGARYITVAGNYAYITCERGLVIVSIEDPLAPRVVAEMGAPDLIDPFAVTIQFRYAFLTDKEGLKVVDITKIDRPRLAARLALDEARDVYVARTYAYVANGSKGLAIVDVEQPEKPKLYMTYDAGGQLNDTSSVRVGSAYNSVFAYVADGANGIRIIQLISPATTPGAQGFSPAPTPEQIATYATPGPAITLSKGADRDRAVDESGNQVSVFGRLGARPFTRPEMERLFLRGGRVFFVDDDELPGGRRNFVRPYEPTPGFDPDAPQVQPAAPGEERLLPGRM